MHTARVSSGAPAKTSVGTRIPVVYPVLLVLALGIAVSLGLFSLARSLEDAHATQEFAASADDRREALQRNLDGALDALYSLKALMESQARVQRDEFRIFAHNLLARHPEILSVEWLPRIARGERGEFISRVRQTGLPDFEITRSVAPGKYAPAPENDEYFPALYVEPLAENREELGFDPSTDAVRAAVMRRASETRMASASKAVALLRPRPDGQHPRAILLFAPVYAVVPAQGTPQPEKPTLAGYTRTTVLVERIVETAWHEQSRGEWNTVILDTDDPGRPVYRFPPAPDSARFRSRHRWDGAVRFADQSWKVELRPSAASANQALGWWSRSVLGGGLLVTLLGAAYVRTVLRRRQEQCLADQQLARLASTAPGAIYSFRLRPDGTSCFPYVSPQIHELFGLNAEDLVADSTPAFSKVHPDDLGALQSTIAEAARTFSPWKTVFRARHPAKGWIWIEGSSMPMREPNGDTLWHGFLMDVTERQRADQALHESEQRFRNIYQNASTGIAITDWEGRYVHCNPAYCAIMGYSEKELLQKHFQSLIHPEDGARNLDFVRRLMAGDIPSFEMENRYVRKNGTTARVHRFVSVLRDDKGNPVNLMALVSDVTEQRNAEEKTHRERERLRRMVDTAQVGIVILSPEGEVREANDALLRMIGWTREEFAAQGLHWRKLTPPEYRDLNRKAAEELSRRGSAEPAERVILRKDDTRIPVLCNGVMLPGDQGHEFAVFVTDLTEQRRLEGALQDAGEAAQARIARDLHDGLGQQLGGVLYLGRLLQHDLKARGAPEAGQAAELNSLVKDALNLTRHVARGLHPVPAQPDGLMLALQALIEQVARGAKATLIFECQPPVLLEDVRVASHLYRIAQEALNNALKHSRATRIEVALWRDPAAIYLAVRDNGIGLAHGPAGHGLGMHTMKHRARLVGGLLTIENASDGGAKITCQVPLPFPTPHGPQAPTLNPETVAGPKQREDGSPLTHSSPQPIP